MRNIWQKELPEPQVVAIIDKDMRERIKTSNNRNAYRMAQRADIQAQDRMKNARLQEMLKRFSKPLFDGK